MKTRNVGFVALACALIGGFLGAQTTRQTTLPTTLFSAAELVARPSAVGDSTPIVRSPTGTLDEFEMHLTTLNPGQRPHAPHQHPYEELVILKEGTLEVTVKDKTMPMPAGSVLFLAPNEMHGWVNSGTTPAKYVIVTWKTPKSVAK
jgi:quercetin dioxygenase-like cupin family protein